VEPIAVELDGQPMLRPAAIDPAATGRAIGDREREPFVAQELEKSRFERRERDVNVPVNNSAELPRPDSTAGERARPRRWLG